MDVLLYEAGRRRERWEKRKGKKLEEVYTEKGKQTHPSAIGFGTVNRLTEVN